MTGDEECDPVGKEISVQSSLKDKLILKNRIINFEKIWKRRYIRLYL